MIKQRAKGTLTEDLERSLKKKEKEKKILLLQSQLESQQLFSHELLLCTMGKKAKMNAAFILTSKSFRKGPVYYST